MMIHEALDEGNAALTSIGIENPSLDTSLLLAGILNTSRSSLIANVNQQIDDESIAAFNELIMRRMEGECVAYILGKKEFFGLEFLVNPSVLVPRPETELLVEVVIRELGDQGSGIWDLGENEGQGLKVLDLCTGSGAVAIALKHEIPILEVWAADISNEALEVAKNNATRLLPPDAITFCQGNLYDALLSLTTHGTSLLAHCSQLLVHNSFSFIVANPPYVSTDHIPGLSPEVRAEPILALDGGSDGLDLIRIIISQAPEFLCPGGMLLLEADPSQMKAITTLFQQAGFTDIQIHKGLSGSERVVGARKAK